MDQDTFFLLSQLESHVEDIREGALSLLVETREKAAIQPIMRRLSKTRDLEEKRNLIEALGILRAETAVPRLLQRLQRSEDGPLQVTLLLALLRINSSSGATRLRKMLQRLTHRSLLQAFLSFASDSQDFTQELQDNASLRWIAQQILQVSVSPQVCIQLIGQIWQVPSRWARQTLCETLLHPIDTIRTAALDALHRRNEHREGKRFLLPHTRSSDPESRQRAFTALFDLVSSRDLRHLQHGLQDPSPVIRRISLKTWVHHAPKRALEPLKAALRDPHPSVRQAAVLSITSTFAGLYPSLLQALQDPTRLVQRAAVQALCAFPSKETATHLLDFLYALQEEIQKKSHPYSTQSPSKDELGVAEREELRGQTLDALEEIGLSQDAQQKLHALWQAYPQDTLLHAELLYTLARRDILEGPSLLLEHLQSPALGKAAQAAFEDLDQPESIERFAALFPLLTPQKKHLLLSLHPRHRTQPLEVMLLTIMRERDPKLRREALRQFAHLPAVFPSSVEADQIKCSALKDPDERVRREALLHGQAPFSSQQIEILLALLEDPNEEIRCTSLQHLGTCPAQHVKQTIQNLAEQAFSDPPRYSQNDWSALLGAAYQQSLPLDPQALIAQYKDATAVCLKAYKNKRSGIEDYSAYFSQEDATPSFPELRVALLQKLSQDAPLGSQKDEYIKLLSDALLDHRVFMQEVALEIIRETEEEQLFDLLAQREIDYSLTGDIFYTQLWLAPEKTPLPKTKRSRRELLPHKAERCLWKQTHFLKQAGRDQRWKIRRQPPSQVPWATQADIALDAELALASRMKQRLLQASLHEEQTETIKAHALALAHLAGEEFEACIPGTSASQRFDAWWSVVHFSSSHTAPTTHQDALDAHLFDE